jgi:ABC-type bacteriocin/lantibiotic exporter with double-glycine peptidase domain
MYNYNYDYKLISIGLLSGIIGSYYNVYINHYTGLIIQGDFSNETLYNLYYTSMISIIFVSIRGSLFTYIQKNIYYKLKNDVYQKLLNQSTVFYETTPISVLNNYINDDCRIISDILSLNINVITRSIINVIFTYYLLYQISFKLCLMVSLIIPFNYLITYIYDKTYKYLMKDFDEKNKNLNNYVHESISHISMIKSFAIEEYSYKKFSNLINELNSFIFKESYLYGFNAFINFNMQNVSMILIIITAKYLDLTDGLINFILHYKSLYSTINDLINVKTEMAKSIKSYERINSIIKSETLNKGSYITPNNKFEPLITFKDINFKYHNSSNLILKDFNFNINANEKIGIIGASGCGKSTIAKLLTGILTPTDGIIYINGINFNYYDNKWIKSKIGYVSQETILFSDTITNNIAYGLEKFDFNDVKNAAELANADEFIMKLKDKYETKFEGTELSSLSGGQKQRINIARALMRNPQIIIFDEATSALDPYCEEIVQNSIKKIFDVNVNNQKRTIIIIAHRKSALELANKVYKLDNSSIELI